MLERRLWRKWLLRQRAFGHYLTRAIVVGRRDDVEYVVAQIAASSGAAYRVVGAAVDDAPGGELTVGERRIPVVARRDGVATAAAAVNADAVIVAGQPDEGGEFVRQLGLGPGGHRRRAGALVTAHGCRRPADPLPSRRRPPPDPRRDADVRGRQAHPQALGRHRPLRDRDRRADAAHARHRRAPEARQPGPDPVPPAALQPQRRDVPDAEVPFDGGDRRGRPRRPARPERGLRRALQAAQRPEGHPRRPDAAQVLARRASAALERARRRHEHRRARGRRSSARWPATREACIAACSSSRG